MKFFILCASILFVTAFATTARSQSPIECPAGYVCISQTAANQSAQLAREAPAKDEKIKALTEALTKKDEIIADVRATAAKNEADLKEALTRTQTDLASKTGQLIGCEANQTRQLAVIDVLLKNVRPKKIGLINF